MRLVSPAAAGERTPRPTRSSPSAAVGTRRLTDGRDRPTTRLTIPSRNEVPTMTHRWDEFSKSLAEPVPRRESLRRLGARAGRRRPQPAGDRLGGRQAEPAGTDPCKTFCQCRNKAQQNACLAACRACNGDTRRLCGTCGSYVCCGNGQTCCGRTAPISPMTSTTAGPAATCVRSPVPTSIGACVTGSCVYTCVEGAVRCNGTCTFLDRDPNNCGACGNVCGESTPYCSWGQCWDANCGGANLDWDWQNCGRCGNVCPYGSSCSFGVCGSPGGGDGGY